MNPSAHPRCTGALHCKSRRIGEAMDESSSGCEKLLSSPWCSCCLTFLLGYFRSRRSSDQSNEAPHGDRTHGSAHVSRTERAEREAASIQSVGSEPSSRCRLWRGKTGTTRAELIRRLFVIFSHLAVEDRYQLRPIRSGYSHGISESSSRRSEHCVVRTPPYCERQVEGFEAESEVYGVTGSRSARGWMGPGQKC